MTAPAIRTLAVLGLVWTACAAALYVLLMLAYPETGGVLDGRSWAALAQFAGLVAVFVRLYALRHWAAVAACLYCLYMVLQSRGSGIAAYSLAWVAISVTLAALVYRAGRGGLLRPGF